MRMALTVICLVVALWPNQIAIDRKTVNSHSAGTRIEQQPTATALLIALRPLQNSVRTAHAITEATHPIAEQIAFAAEPLVEVPIEKVCATLVAAAEASGLPAPFFLRLIWQESRFDQRAVSPAGALGVAQFMPEVAAERGLERPFDPLAALWASAFFLREHYQTFGNLGLAAMAYNAGARRIQDWLARRGKLPQETRKYVTLITGHAPEKWTEPRSLALTLPLPRNAPCGEATGLSDGASVTRIEVQLEAPIRKIVETAKAEAARAAAARKARLATALQNKKKKLARAKNNKGKTAQQKSFVAKARNAKSASKKLTNLAKPATPRARTGTKQTARAAMKHRARLASN